MSTPSIWSASRHPPLRSNLPKSKHIFTLGSKASRSETSATRSRLARTWHGHRAHFMRCLGLQGVGMGREWSCEGSCLGNETWLRPRPCQRRLTEPPRLQGQGPGMIKQGNAALSLHEVSLAAQLFSLGSTLVPSATNLAQAHLPQGTNRRGSPVSTCKVENRNFTTAPHYTLSLSCLGL